MIVMLQLECQDKSKEPNSIHPLIVGSFADQTLSISFITAVPCVRLDSSLLFYLALSPPKAELRGAAVFRRVLLERFVGLLLRFVCLELSIELIKFAELLKDFIDLCHLQASLCQPDPVSSPSSS